MELIENKVLIFSGRSWIIAQIINIIIALITEKRFRPDRIFGDGGMPSGHSATVTSVAVVSGLVYGLGSFECAISVVLAIIVCHDACGVRRETGKQAVLLNEIPELINNLSTDKLSDEVKLKVFVGHTIPQVIAGILTGAINATVLHHLFFA